MAVRDENYNWTKSALELDDKLRKNVGPIIEKAIEDGMEIEDVYYVASMYINSKLLRIVNKERFEHIRLKNEMKE